MIELLYNTLAMGKGISSSYQGAGGVPPYTYTVIPDADFPSGGSINANGLYVAGPQEGIDVIRVTDSTSAFAEQTVHVLNPLELFADIVAKEMGLAEDQVYIYNQKIKPITDDRLYIAIGIAFDKHFGNSTKAEPTADGMVVVQSTNVQSNLSIDILSRGDDARNRRYEIVLALNSIYSQTQQELNSFKVGVVPQNFNNLSREEGAAIPFRFNINVFVQYFVKKVKPVAYYDVFQGVNTIINK